MGKLDGKVVVVTGGGAGLGRGFAMGMAREGASVVVNDVVEELAKKVVEEIKKEEGSATPCIGGVGTKDTADKLVNTAIKEFGTLHVLVNNAGVTRDALVHKMSEDQWDTVINIHLRGTFLNTQAAVKHFIENKIKGRVINITSSAGIYGNVGQANYSAAKAGLIGLTLSNARELIRYGICVNAIAPGAKTAMTEAMPEKIRNMMYEKLAQSTVQRVGEPEDVAPMVIFLASDESYYVTGQVIAVMGTTGVI
jgi:NAD(P)-dependent dehydrogenase (short-subunit alcohol dehydrogenase family)